MMKTKLLSFILLVISLTFGIAILRAETYSGSCGENLRYTFDSNTGVLNITGSGPMKKWKTYDAAPWHIDYEHITIVNLPEGLTTIGDYAFGGEQIKSIKLPSTIKTIGNHAFAGCYKLEFINIPEGCLYIEDFAFSGCHELKSLKIANSVVYIGEEAFYACSSMKTFNLPINLKRLGKKAFGGVGLITDIQEITLPKGLTAIKEGTFSGRWFKTIHIHSGINVIEDDAFHADRVCITDLDAWCNIEFKLHHSTPLEHGYLVVNGELIKELIIPEGVTRISDYAFCRYKNLNTVTIPKTVEYIGTSAFYECNDLTDVYNHAEKIIPIKKGTFYTYRPNGVIDFYVDADKVSAYQQMQEKWYEAEKFTPRKLKIHAFQTSQSELSNPYINEIINYEDADEQPQFIGGTQAFIKYRNANLHCPLSANEISEFYEYDDVIDTKVTCQFIVDLDGSIIDVRAVQCIVKSKYISPMNQEIAEKKFSNEAIRFIKSMPKWTPGAYRGYPVRVKCQVPIEFKYRINHN